MNILIPAYKPNIEIKNLTNELIEMGYRVIVVDDGSGEDYKEIFSALDDSVIYLQHECNQGKGRAIKTGLSYVRENFSDQGVVTADADGQHLPKDIKKVSDLLECNQNKIIIGARLFCGQVPLRSRLGNRITRFVFAVLSGLRLKDTQTGLRGIPPLYYEEMIHLEGERYEYEMNMLMYIAKKNIPVLETDIETVYIEDNASSHFNTWKDSVRIYKVILKNIVRHD